MRRLEQKYRRQRGVLVTLLVLGRDRKGLLQQLVLRQTIGARTLKRRLAIQRTTIQKTWHPGSWRRFVARRAANGDARVIRLVQQREQERSPWDLARGS